MNVRKPQLWLAPILLALVACSSEPPANLESNLAEVDAVFLQIDNSAGTAGLELVTQIDHSRMAAEVDGILDASQVRLYTHRETNSQLMAENIRAGLDLPFRVIGFAEDGDIRVRYTDSSFIRQRHAIDNPVALEKMDDLLSQLTAGVANADPLGTASLSQDYGIVELLSTFPIDETVTRLKEVVMAEGDTIWFVTIDFQAEALKSEIQLPAVRLLVFGAPGPGAKAMRDYPSIGLDAFGQKVLVYQQDDQVKVIFNDIKAFAQLHYQDSALPHTVINRRLKKTLSSAIEEP